MEEQPRVATEPSTTPTVPQPTEGSGVLPAPPTEPTTAGQSDKTLTTPQPELVASSPSEGVSEAAPLDETEVWEEEDFESSDEEGMGSAVEITGPGTRLRRRK